MSTPAIIGAVVGAFAAVDALAVYCAVRVGAEADRLRDQARSRELARARRGMDALMPTDATTPSGDFPGTVL